MENKKIKIIIPLIFFILMVILIPNTYKKIQKDNCLNEWKIWEGNICKEKILNSWSLETIWTWKNN